MPAAPLDLRRPLLAGLRPDAEPGCLLVAEVAQTHDGSLGQAHAFVDAAARAGADAIKFQTHLAAAESTAREPWRVRFSPQDATRYDYWKRMEWTEEEWRGLARHAAEKRLVFLSSPFSRAAVDLLERVGVPAWKIASGELSDPAVFAAIAATGKPVLLSTGMSPLAEIDGAVARLVAHRLPIAVLQCTSAYPCPPEKVGLNLLALFRERYGTAVGLSDHSGTIFPGLAAATLGVEVLEVHLTLSRDIFGPDVPSSVTTAELATLAEGIRFIERMKAHPVDKDAVAAELEPLRRLFRKSVVAARDLVAGTVLAATDLAFKKPGTGLPAERYAELVGRRLARDLAADDEVRPEDVDHAAETDR